MNSVTWHPLPEEISHSPKNSVTFYILGFDRPGFTHDILKAIHCEDGVTVQSMKIESSGLRAEGFLQLQVMRPEVIPLFQQRLKVVAGSVFVRLYTSA